MKKLNLITLCFTLFPHVLLAAREPLDELTSYEQVQRLVGSHGELSHLRPSEFILKCQRERDQWAALDVLVDTDFVEAISEGQRLREVKKVGKEHWGRFWGKYRTTYTVKKFLLSIHEVRILSEEQLLAMCEKFETKLPSYKVDSGRDWKGRKKTLSRKTRSNNNSVLPGWSQFVRSCSYNTSSQYELTCGFEQVRYFVPENVRYTGLPAIRKPKNDEVFSVLQSNMFFYELKGRKQVAYKALEGEHGKSKSMAVPEFLNFESHILTTKLKVKCSDLKGSTSPVRICDEKVKRDFKDFQLLGGGQIRLRRR
jgi:hypothetical protein